MKKWLSGFISLALVGALAACGGGGTDNNNASQPEGGSESAPEAVTIKVGATPVPHAQILEHIKPALAEEGVNLEIVEFTDYQMPNTQVDSKELDANFFQHQPYLDGEINARGLELEPVIAVHIEPLGVYSRTITSIDELKDGAVVAIPNDPTNLGRALSLLSKNGVIKLEDENKLEATTRDIVENPKNLKFQDVDAAMLPRMLDEMDLAVINTNYALEADLDPTKDSLLLEDKDNPYANLLVARPDNKDSDAIQKLAKALTTEDVRSFIEQEFGGAVVPAF
ncbi:MULTISPECIES: MetQ/NlpA family ABC transporter substrate-binding protein [Paenibacillus]|uniref:Lipoprotein n=1 Tax=Paenibacillus campinasensis TaxID=66347 RepID=A0A268EXT9_9BACL|nr:MULTISPECIES: MetQ/NlpA family ABC transporter substrate-binding protein [Paenibacillus]MUG66477.1 MetQ/NlpA family lipoprotein [Paenibacillus campinasensis]PAD77945.1 methionine ABC transporter substrate-binding protein [Paenibacillus campinasensis]PAK52973.1 methionine ABC transporter substrate-binding protein [Paenibacillus sp. 7541]